MWNPGVAVRQSCREVARSIIGDTSFDKDNANIRLYVSKHSVRRLVFPPPMEAKIAPCEHGTKMGARGFIPITKVTSGKINSF